LRVPPRHPRCRLSRAVPKEKPVRCALAEKSIDTQKTKDGVKISHKERGQISQGLRFITVVPFRFSRTLPSGVVENGGFTPPRGGTPTPEGNHKKKFSPATCRHNLVRCKPPWTRSTSSITRKIIFLRTSSSILFMVVFHDDAGCDPAQLYTSFYRWKWEIKRTIWG